jgi:hypothetical protein
MDEFHSSQFILSILFEVSGHLIVSLLIVPDCSAGLLVIGVLLFASALGKGLLLFSYCY